MNNPERLQIIITILSAILILTLGFFGGKLITAIEVFMHHNDMELTMMTALLFRLFPSNSSAFFLFNNTDSIDCSGSRVIQQTNQL